MPFRIFEVTHGPTPPFARFVVEEDRPTTMHALAETIRATGALAVTVAPFSPAFDDLGEANCAAARLAEQYQTRATMYVPPAPKRRPVRRVVTRYFRRVSIGASHVLSYPSAE